MITCYSSATHRSILSFGLVILALVMSAFPSPASAQTPPAESAIEQAFRDALFLDEAKGQPAEALAAYTKVVEHFEKERHMAATALFRLAECHQKLKAIPQAAEAYRKLLQRFPDETALVEKARSALTAMGEALPAAAAASMASKAPAPVAVPAGAPMDREDQAIAIIRDKLVEHPDWLDGGQSGNESPLAEALKSGQIKMARFLIKSGAKVTALAPDGRPADGDSCSQSPSEPEWRRLSSSHLMTSW
jgi:tetratricopeptide (TPR) repeat protein